MTVGIDLASVTTHSTGFPLNASEWNSRLTDLNVAFQNGTKDIYPRQIIITMNAGENLTAGDFVRNVGGLLMKTDSASLAGITNFVGCALETKTTGNACRVAINKVSGLSGLAAGTTYYIGTSGAITASKPVDYPLAIGVALSTTELELRVTLQKDILIYHAENNANPALRIGSSAAEDLMIQTIYDSGAQTLDYVGFFTRAASATANKGLYRFHVDGSAILDINDSGISTSGGVFTGPITASGGFSGNVTISGDLTVSGGGLNVGINDTTTEALGAFINLYGGGAGTVEGGQVNLYLSADYDASFERFVIDAYQDDLRIYREGVSSDDLIIYGDSGNIGLASNVLYIDAVNDRVGISIGTSPSATLDVKDNISIKGATADESRLYFSASDNTRRFTFFADMDGATANDVLYISTTDTANAITLLANGSLGVGTNPSSKIEVLPDLSIKGAGGTEESRLYFSASDNSRRFTFFADMDGATANDVLYISTTDTANAITLLANGSLGVGTTSPGSSLHVAGAMPTAPTGAGVHMGLSSSDAGIQINGANSSSVPFIDFSYAGGGDTSCRISYSNASANLLADAGAGTITLGNNNGSITLNANGTVSITDPTIFSSYISATIGTFSGDIDAVNAVFSGDTSSNRFVNSGADENISLYCSGNTVSGTGDVIITSSHTTGSTIASKYAVDIFTSVVGRTITNYAYFNLGVTTASGGTITTSHLLKSNTGANTCIDSGSTKTTPGGVDYWVKIDVGGGTHYIPAYASKTA